MNIYEQVRERDRHICRGCGTGVGIEVHHINFRSQGGPDEAWNLISLCKKCHGRAHSTYGSATYPKWLLLQMVAMGITVPAFTFLKAVPRLKRYQMCLSCERYGAAGYCAIWEEEYRWDYWCSAWKLQETG